MQIDQTFTLPEFINPSWRIAIIGTQYYKEYIDRMVAGAKEVLLDADLQEQNILEYTVLGSWEVPLIGTALAKQKRVDAIIGFGIIVQGETYHDQHLANQTARAMMNVQTEYGMPFAYEILHVKTIDQVPSRTEGSFNKGTEAATAVLHSLAALQNI